MARKLPDCPLCGAKCRVSPCTAEFVVCSKHVRALGPDDDFRESGCAYEVPDLRAHEAICARLAEKPKGPKGPKVIARGYWCRNVKAVGLCGGPLPNGCNDHQRRDAGCQRVLIVRAGR